MEDFGPYRLIRRIGLGDFAEVFTATRLDARDDVRDRGRELNGSQPRDAPLAIKRVTREMVHNDAIQALLAKEGQLARHFDHPNVVRVFSADKVDNRSYLAMEYIPGASVYDLLARVAPARLPPGAIVRIGLDACAGLGYLHEVRDPSGDWLAVVHGDLAPRNILCSASGAIRLIDFSAAVSRLRDPDDRTVRGTYAYMSPEQVRGRPIDRRSDVFSLGVVLWELFSGQRLFHRSAQYLTLAAVVEQPVPGLRDLAAVDLGPALSAVDAVLARALAKDPSERYPDAPSLGAALSELTERFDWDSEPSSLAALVCE